MIELLIIVAGVSLAIWISNSTKRGSSKARSSYLSESQDWYIGMINVHASEHADDSEYSQRADDAKHGIERGESWWADFREQNRQRHLAPLLSQEALYERAREKEDSYDQTARALAKRRDGR